MKSKKTLTEKLPLPKTLLNKLCRILVAHGAGIIGGGLVFLSGAGCISPIEEKSKPCFVGGAFLTVFGALSSIVLIANIVDKLLENKPEGCAKALTSFINKWPEYKVQTPQVLQGMFDGLYAKRQVANCGLTDAQAQQLVEGVLALSVAAQVV